MTHEEAFQRIELPEGTDIQEVRRKFAAMHGDYRMRIDNAPTPRLRQMFEQQLEHIKEAYSLLNGSEGVNDTIDLPRTKRVLYEDAARENQSAKVKPENSSQYSLLDAYDYFGLSPEDGKVTFDQLTKTKLEDLENGLQSQFLAPAKKLYEEELVKAKKLIAILLTDRQAKEYLARKRAEQSALDQLAKEKAQKKQEKLSGDFIEEHTDGKTKRKRILIIGLAAVIIIGALALLILKPGLNSAPVLFEHNGLYGYKKGDYLFIWPRYNTASTFKGGEARVSVNDSNFYIDETGKFLRFADSVNKRTADENAPNPKFVKDSLTEVHSEQEPLHTINTDTEKVKGNATNNTASKKSVEDLLQLGNEHFDKRNYGPARNYYEKAVKKGSSKAMYKLGYLYANGLGFPSDYKKAIYWYGMAVNNGEVEAMVLLGVLYANDYAGLRDNMGNREYKKAKYWYERAIDSGNHRAALNGLGWLYYFGHGVAKDYKKAAMLFEEAAQNGYAASMYALGNLYRNGGHGVQKDDSLAKYWYERDALPAMILPVPN
ncbi:sel1 repeat family protein [Arachidicoccus ginsenosidivorans]|uniref:Sel1 repeat family protein n=1 Tax=Arachidicoccus ginsenosidivorans TaxID=496057 RepID=A0A5B8VJP3_9BACT|nr:tetratricopeptide repeat protein [Arachidicoccus ginsenosidivorans]QEC71205.1 sel1 repeat family protein [Arachidicoccus ginsenosidivorans]